MNLSSFQQRIFSAAVLGPAVLALIYIGGWAFFSMVVAFSALAIYEWGKLSLKPNKSYIMLVLGALYISFGMLCTYKIRAHLGVELAFLFIVMVWASDVGGYFVGKTLGGPKMAKDISPNKTWAGCGGALLFPAILACVYIFISSLMTGGKDITSFDLISVFVTGVVIGITGQVGDLLISWFKRRAKVKDTGDLIPGHGGILDRIDSLLLCAPVFLFLILLMQYSFHG